MHRTTKIKITDLNAHLVCYLCGGYYIDATTIIECLHSFCKTCIVRYLQNNKYCPVCEVQVHKTRPLLNIRADKTLQDIVYKLVPGLFKAEMKRRRQYYAEHPRVDTSSSLNSHEDRGEVEDHRFFYTAEESISLSLEYAENGRVPSSETTSETVVEAVNDDESSPRKRFLRCPAAVTVAHLKKLIRMKYSLSDEFLIDIFYNNDCLYDDYTLMDVAYIFTWRRNGPMRFMYRILKRKPRSAKRLKTSHEPVITAPPLIEITCEEKGKQDPTPSNTTSAPPLLQNGHEEEDEGKATAAKSAPEPRPTPPPPPLTNGMAEADAAETPALEASEPEPARAQPSPVDPPTSEAASSARHSSGSEPLEKKEASSSCQSQKNESGNAQGKDKDGDKKTLREENAASTSEEKKKNDAPEDEPRRDDFGALDLSKSSSRHPSRSSSSSSRSSPAVPNDAPTPPPPSTLSPPRLPPTPSPPAPASAAPPSPVLPRPAPPPPPPPPSPHTQPLQVRVRAPVSTPPSHIASVTPSQRGLPAVVPQRPVAPLRLQQANLSGTRLIPAGHRSTQTPTSGSRLNQVISGLRGTQQQQQQKQQQQQQMQSQQHQPQVQVQPTSQQQHTPASSTGNGNAGVNQNRPRLTLTIPRPFIRHSSNLNFSSGNQRGSSHHHHHSSSSTSSASSFSQQQTTSSHHHHHHHHHHHPQHPPHIPISRGLPSRPQHAQPVAKKSASDHMVCHRGDSSTSKHLLQNGEKTAEVAQAN